MNPHDALTEIATLLERERSSRYKSKAFRAAADAIAGLTDEQLRDAASLRRRKGIGDSTFAVIQEALGGNVPDGFGDPHYARQVVARADRKDEPRVQRFVELYRSPEVKAYISQKYGRYFVPVW